MSRPATKRKKIKGGFAAVKKRILNLEATSVDVGLLKTAPKYPPGPPGYGQNVASVGAINALGLNPRAPRRDFMAAFVAVAKEKYHKVLTSLMTSVLEGRVDAEKGWRNLGIRAVKDMRKVIEKWSTPPNAALTIFLKGFNDPLIRTKHMIKSIDYRINK